MKFIRVKNLHCLEDTGIVPLKAINFFVGANSTGKSSLLRVFPLLRQSLIYNKKGLFLWFGDRVDFGSYSEAHRINGGEMFFSFSIDLDLGIIRRSALTKTPFIFEFTLNSLAKVEYIQKIKISFSSYSIVFQFTSGNRVKSFIINDTDYSFIAKNLNIPEITRLVPQVRYVNTTKKTKGTRKIFIDENIIIARLLKYSALKDLFVPQDLQSLFEAIRLDTPERLLMKLRESEKKFPAIGGWTVDHPLFKSFCDLYFIYHLESLLMEIDYLSTDVLSDIYYMGPYRAAVERYYRIQNIAVREIDPHGENLAMYLGNLSANDYDSLKQWMIDNFHFYITTDSSRGHLSMMLVDPSQNEKFNIIDKGFGLSQLLPIVVMLWHIQRRGIDGLVHSKKRLFAIEQPELHLHPKLIRLLADTFVSCVRVMREIGVDFQLILETHSPSLINRIGDLISMSRIDKDDVSVVLFNDLNEERNIKQVEVVQFNEDGILENWPIGFLDA